MATSYRLLCALLQVALIFAAPYVTIPATILSALMFGVFWAVMAPFISELFGETHFGKNWGMLMLSPAASGVVYQQISGAVYEAHITDGGTRCSGLECYQLAFVVCLLLLVVSLLASILLLRRAPLPAWAAAPGSNPGAGKKDGDYEAGTQLQLSEKAMLEASDAK